MKHRILLASLFLLVISFASAQAQTYTITDLGQLAPTAINSWAEVVGNQNGHGFVWARGWGKHDLGLLPGGTSSYATSINDRGAVTGTAYGNGTAVPLGFSYSNVQCPNLGQPFLWTPKNGIVGLGVAFPSIMADYGEFCLPFYATGINDRGEIVGYTADGPDLYQFDFLWTSGGFTLFGNTYSMATVNGVNNKNQIVGQIGIGCECNVAQAGTWTNIVPTGTLQYTNGGTPLETLTAGANKLNNSSALGINDRGQLVGWSNASATAPFFCTDDATECPVHAVLWSKTGAISDLGTLPGDTVSMAVAINLFGKVVGTSGNTFGQTTGEVVGRPFIWSASNGMQDLNTLIPAGGWVLNSVSDINVWGQIVGSGTLDGESHGFLLTPQ